jgi:hypothetical protein
MAPQDRRFVVVSMSLISMAELSKQQQQHQLKKNIIIGPHKSEHL